MAELHHNLGDLETLITNNVLVSRPVSRLNVHVFKEKSMKKLKEENDLELRVKGSYEDTWKVALESGLAESFPFHYTTYWESELNAHLKHCSSNEEQDKENSSASLIMPLKFLSSGKDVKVILPVSEDSDLELKLHTKTCSEHLDVRLGFDLCKEENSFLHKRKEVVAAALKNILHLKDNLQDHEVPVVAVMATGSGCRSMVSFCGQLSGLQKLNILDCITYISSTSGSAWVASNLYKDSNWSQKDLARPIHEAKKHLTKNKISTFSLDHLIHYQTELKHRDEQGISTSFSDLWAVALETILHDKVDDFKLSDQQQAVNEGQNPLPLYLALNVKENQISAFNFKDCQLDHFPNRLTPSEDEISLDAAAYFINTSCPPLLREERKVDVILSFDYSLDTPFQSVEQMEKCCEKQGIPFPRISLSEEDKKNPRECYLFVDDENKKAPIVLHFPLVLDSFQNFKEPGVKRSKAEMEEGTVPLAGCQSPYHLMNFTYTKKDFDRLLKLTEYNVQNNRDWILQAFCIAIELKKCPAT